MKKKFLKIIQIVYDILSLGFIIFVVCAMAFSPKREGLSNNDDIAVTEVKTRDNIIDNNDINYLITSSDIVSALFINNIFTYYISPSTLIQNPQREFYITDFNVNCVSYENFNMEHWVSSVNTYDITTLVVAYWGESVESNGLRTQEFRYWLTDNSNHNVFVVRALSIVTTYENNDGEIVYDYSGNGFGYVFSLWFNSSDYYLWYNRYDSPVVDEFFRHIEDDLITDKKGYDEGYQYGLKVGYQQSQTNMASAIANARDEGYNAGLVDGARGIESNAFTVMGQAFSAVGSIFSIEVLPGLPLWILVFTPLIIAVVIVVVKMIKG